MNRIHEVLRVTPDRFLIAYHQAPGLLRNLPYYFVITGISLDQPVDRHIGHVVKTGRRRPCLLFWRLFISQLGRKRDEYHERRHSLTGLYKIFQISPEGRGQRLLVESEFPLYLMRGALFRRSEEHTSELQSRQYLVC